MHRLLLLLPIFILHQGLTQSNSFNLPFQNPDSVRVELSELFDELRIKHPGFYRYNDKVEFDQCIDSTINTIQSPITEFEILKKTKPLIAKIGCLHTNIYLSPQTDSLLNLSPNCMPFSLYRTQGKAFIWKVFNTESSALVGQEIKTINGRNIDDIYDILLKSMSMDGLNESGKYALLQYTFPEWYRSVIEIESEFDIELGDGSTITAQAVKKSATLDYTDIVNEPMSMKTIDSIAILKIPSFANSYLKARNQEFRKEIKSYFRAIQQEEIAYLMIDLRGNTGGSDSNPAWLSSYFFDAPFKYWDKIEITEPLAKGVTGLKRIFYGKPKLVDGSWHWSDKGLFSKEFKFTRLQKPSKPPIKSKVYLLTDGLCMSSCSDFIAILQANNKVLVIGEETGGGYQGNTSGLVPTEQLICGLIVSIPLLKYTNAVPKEKNIGRGCMADIEIKPRLEELEDDEVFLQKVIKTIQ